MKPVTLSSAQNITVAFNKMPSVHSQVKQYGSRILVVFGLAYKTDRFTSTL